MKETIIQSESEKDKNSKSRQPRRAKARFIRNSRNRQPRWTKAIFIKNSRGRQTRSAKATLIRNLRYIPTKETVKLSFKNTINIPNEYILSNNIKEGETLNMMVDSQVKKKIKELYAFRGNIILTNSSEETRKLNNSISKNKIFASFFKYLKEIKSDNLKYQNQKYSLVIIEKYDTIIHCQLNKIYNENKKCVTSKIVNNFSINFFVELKSQKILIEGDENYSTFISIIENIMNKYLKYYGAAININCIVQEEEFWKKFYEFDGIKSIKIDFTVPNLFGANDALTDFLKSVNENTGATNVLLNLTNPEGDLNIDKEKIKHIAQYSFEGGGKLEIKGQDKEKKSKTIKSYQEIVKTKTEICITSKNSLNKENVKKIKSVMLEVEKIDKFKENFDEKNKNNEENDQKNNN